MDLQLDFSLMPPWASEEDADDWCSAAWVEQPDDELPGPPQPRASHFKNVPAEIPPYDLPSLDCSGGSGLSWVDMGGSDSNPSAMDQDTPSVVPDYSTSPPMDTPHSPFSTPNQGTLADVQTVRAAHPTLAPPRLFFARPDVINGGSTPHAWLTISDLRNSHVYSRWTCPSRKRRRLHTRKSWRG
jgi:hypothetical protein